MEDILYIIINSFTLKRERTEAGRIPGEEGGGGGGGAVFKAVCSRGDLLTF